ncbi:39S ribosomal protein L9, mitochondrial [Habropoda laboriosa]|uniref:39S ribosomal protein L9, mitochondrial n=2 Tax=Habropoda laboriosa TaxID=597456 RepID=A0A0L7QMB3_9HYME|nr:39S ribosomal protein L9, mitochondrial [Habropoda laboriosa]
MGQKITLPSVKAYEKFILPKLAVYATPENIEKYLIQDIEDRKKLCAYSSQFVERTICVLSQCYLRLRMSLDVPWTIEKWHLRVCFRMQGLIVPENAIILPEKAISGPDISIENREFYVTVKINDHEKVKVRCKIHQYTSDPEREIIYDTPYYQFASRAIFPEDQEILNSLPRHRLANKEIRDETEENTEDLE